jgi:hypothetical protein
MKDKYEEGEKLKKLGGWWSIVGARKLIRNCYWKSLLETTTKNHYWKLLLEITIGNYSLKSLLEIAIGNHY